MCNTKIFGDFVITGPRKILYFTIACCLLGALSVGLANRDAIAKQFDNWYLVPRPERLTELYFTDSAQLPKSLKAQEPHVVAFTVHNLEHQTTTYYYKIVVIADNSESQQVLGDGTFKLDHDGTHFGRENIIIPKVAPRLGIRVDLYYQGVGFGNNTSSIQNQSIQYWVGVADAVDKVIP